MSALEQLLDHYDVVVRGAGVNKNMKCPVHEDRNASATMNSDKEVWYCHTCGQGGSVFDLVMLKEGMDFATSLAFVEGITGTSSTRARAEPGPRKRLPPGAGYQPRYRRKVQARRSPRVEY